MTDEPERGSEYSEDARSVEMPRSTIAPFVVAVGVTLIASGFVLGILFSVVGVVILAVGLGQWIHELLPGRGHVFEAFEERQPKVIEARPGSVEILGPGIPGYRLRLPVEMHPISAGLKGGIVGGAVMPIPALLYGIISGAGIWYPVNLLAAMVLPGVAEMPLEQFHMSLFLVGLTIHATISVVLGLIYGVLLPTLPTIPGSVAWGGLLLPICWSAVTFTMMWFVNPTLQEQVEWPWFLLSQFVFGICAAMIVANSGLSPLWAGTLGGLVGGVLMALPALLWSVIAKHGLWYPVNLLAGTLLPGVGEAAIEELEQFQPTWFISAVVLHVVLSIGFGIAYGFLLPRLRPIPGQFAWGGMLMPLLWTGLAYGLMGVVNPLLRDNVDWPWFVVSQFVFGVAAAVVVVRSEKVYIPSAGSGPDAAPETQEPTGDDS